MAGKTKEEIAAYNKAYREANKERLREKNKEFRENNKEKLRAMHKDWRENRRSEKSRERERAWREANREHLREYFKKRQKEKSAEISARQRAYYAENKEAYADYERMRRYGLSKQQYIVLMQRQKNSCVCCGLKKKLFVDHCHNTKEVRGLLCLNCNTMIGHAHDNHKNLLSAARYLRKKQQQKTEGQLVLFREEDAD